MPAGDNMRISGIDPATMQQIMQVINQTYNPKQESKGEKAIGAAIGAIGKLVGSLVAHADALFEVLDPILQMLGLLVDAFVIAFQKDIIRFIKQIAEATKVLIGTAMDQRDNTDPEAVGSALGAAFGKWILSFVEGIIPLFNDIILAVVGIFTNPDFIAGIVKAGLAIFEAIAMLLGELIVSSIKRAVRELTNIGNAISSGWSSGMQAGGNTAGKIAMGILGVGSLGIGPLAAGAFS